MIAKCEKALKAKLVTPLEAKVLPDSVELTFAPSGRMAEYTACFQTRTRSGGVMVVLGTCELSMEAEVTGVSSPFEIEPDDELCKAR